MEQAWLDSLSEDWISQPGSSGSLASSPPSSKTSEHMSSHVPSSRIPRYDQRKQSWTVKQDASSNKPLGERSPSDINISSSKRIPRPSKLRAEMSSSPTSLNQSQAPSASSDQSVQHHTMQHKSQNFTETPEWRKRLLHGEVAYGEQRDLFSVTGLESIFHPPPSQEASPSKMPMHLQDQISEVMPSSPPPYHVDEITPEKADQVSDTEQPRLPMDQNRQNTKGMKYRLVDEDISEFAPGSVSQGSDFRLDMARSHSNFNNSDASHNSSFLRPDDLRSAMERAVSGQSVIHNEGLSPIYISKHNTIDGKTEYEAIDISISEAHTRQDELEARDSATEDMSDVFYQQQNMTANTDDFAHNGKFVSRQRGGYSHDGSFRRKMLSSSSVPPAVDESALLSEESMQASTPRELPNVKKTRNSAQLDEERPRTSKSSPSKSNDGQKNGAGSPLKLFGTYDTFTNQKLLRRLSQFEENYQDDSLTDITPVIQNKAEAISAEAFGPAQIRDCTPRVPQFQQNFSRKASNFGAGELDAFQFSEEVSFASNKSDEIKNEVYLPSYGASRFAFKLEPSPALEDSVVMRHQTTRGEPAVIKQVGNRKNSLNSSLSDSDMLDDLSILQKKENLTTPRKQNGNIEGKRLPRSPLKDPEAKRRRTLHNTEISNLNTDLDLDDSIDQSYVQESHQNFQSIIGRKRKDARHGDNQEAANPSILAKRQILQPRRNSQQHDRSKSYDGQIQTPERVRLLMNHNIARVQAELDATQEMTSSPRAAQPMLDGSRKGSVTTQDFLDEAKKIMAGIRGKTRPQSGLTSLAESESENDQNGQFETRNSEDEFEDSYEESTKEPFSRPPSREGKPVSRIPAQQHDPEVLNRLQQYAETNDMDDVIASSVRSIALAKTVVHDVEEIEQMVSITVMDGANQYPSHDIIESEPGIIRFSENPEKYHKRKHSNPSSNIHATHEPEFLSQGSNISSGPSTSRSVPSGSSRGSESRHVIAPHTVSHLIPEQLAGMVFDRERNIWVKRKSSKTSDDSRGRSSDETDDDPFGDIPDLSVDETQELQRIKVVATKVETITSVSSQSIQNDVGHMDNMNEHNPLAQEDARRMSVDDLRSSASMHTRDASSYAGLDVGTRITSWGDDHTIGNSGSTKGFKISEQLNTVTETLESTVQHQDIIEEVEREISIDEARLAAGETQPRRNITIAFSSPLTSLIQPAAYEDQESVDNEPNDIKEDDDASPPESEDESILVTKMQSRQNDSFTRSRVSSRNVSQRYSFHTHTFTGRPVSRIDERDESTSRAMSSQLERSMSVVITTPLPIKKESGVVLATPRPLHEIGTLELTPMSDFTMHQANESFGLEVSYIGGHQRKSNKASALSQNIRGLVEKLTEVEPFEPFWESIKELNLCDKRMSSLHKLDEFCEHVEELDVSKNQISQLNGAPKSLRNLRITHNFLSDLTAWGHLSNLQYVDVSNNELESLSAFSSLFHLRGLRADNNKIKSLHGISNLDGLLSLRLRGNQIQNIDMAGTKLYRLTELDLKGNEIKEVHNLKELRSLTSLNLDENSLDSFLADTEELPSLKYLRLTGNKLSTIDVSKYPNLRLLYLDRNCLGTVTGLLRTQHLDSLSMREQQEGAEINMVLLSEAFEVRKLFLSGNFLPSFQPTTDFLNLQYLELANCGLETLTPGFGQMFPNLRTLNLNFNALRDIKPLLGIVRLKKIFLAGNRLSRIRKTSNVLGQFPGLTTADLRNNPLTQGFYPPVLETRMVLHNGELDEAQNADPFTLAKADVQSDEKYTSRLDMETRMLRRIYEMLLVGGCTRLRYLDGLPINGSILSLEDKVWEALIQKGVVRNSLKGAAETDQIETGVGVESEVARAEDIRNVDGGQEPLVTDREESADQLTEPSMIEERWQAEDSFA